MSTIRRHGIPSSYNRGCRCEACRRANAERHWRNGYQRSAFKRRLEEREWIDGRWVHPNPIKGHGTAAAYASSGCRCEPCRAARSAYIAALKERS